MALSHKARRRWALVLLLVWLPLYVLGALWLVSTFDRLPKVLEVVMYLALGVLWAAPFRTVFLGVGRGENEQKAPRKR
ncbi:MAG: hypothetical protein ACJAW4_001409 [Paracoccaceae bacterium]|jgi:hypothetical protein